MIQCQITRLDEMCKMSEVQIYHSFHETPFGKCLIAFIENKQNERAVCHLAYTDGKEPEAEARLRTRFPGAQFHEDFGKTKEFIDSIFYKDKPNCKTVIKVILKGTDFQMNVWESLISIPMGTLATYEQVAQKLGKPKAARAVAGALKANQIGYLIPCHRVICKNGCNKFSWCVDIKLKMQEFEKQYTQCNEIS